MPAAARCSCRRSRRACTSSTKSPTVHLFLSGKNVRSNSDSVNVLISVSTIGYSVREHQSMLPGYNPSTSDSTASPTSSSTALNTAHGEA